MQVLIRVLTDRERIITSTVCPVGAVKADQENNLSKAGHHYNYTNLSGIVGQNVLSEENCVSSYGQK